MRRITLIAASLAFLTLPAFAQQPLKLEIKDGKVTLDATGVPARVILAEWARIGGTRVVGADKITGTPLTLKLDNMAERQALDIILRNVAGYMAAPRRASSTPGASGYDSIRILPTSAASTASTANTARMPTPPSPIGGIERRVPPPPRPPGIMPRPGQPNVDPNDAPAQEAEPDDQSDNGLNQQPVFTFPQPQMPGNQVFVPVPQGGFGAAGQPGVIQPQITLQPNANGQPTIYNFMPNTGPTAAPNTGGFGVIGSPAPGMIQQPVQPTPGAPGTQRPKPPGGN